MPILCNTSYPEAVWRVQVQFLLQVFRRTGAQPVEDVVVPLVTALHANPRLLQQIVGDEAADNCVLHSTQEGKKLIQHISAPPPPVV